MSERQAAREFGLARKTVRKMLAYAAPPGYQRKKTVARPKLGPWLGLAKGRGSCEYAGLALASAKVALRHPARFSAGSYPRSFNKRKLSAFFSALWNTTRTS
jgi:hypothetical protein